MEKPRTFFAFLPTLTHRLRGSSQKKALASASAFFNEICPCGQAKQLGCEIFANAIETRDC